MPCGTLPDTATFLSAGARSDTNSAIIPTISNAIVIAGSCLYRYRLRPTGHPGGAVSMTGTSHVWFAQSLTKDVNVPADEAGDESLQLVLAELKRVENQQAKLKDAVDNGKAIVVHPRVEDEETPRALTPKDMVVASGGLTGFGGGSRSVAVGFQYP